MFLEQQLKQLCQYMINAIIQNASIRGKNMIPYPDKSYFYQHSQIMVDLDKQSESFSLFHSDQSDHKHWMAMLLDHLKQITQSTSPKQFMHSLFKEDQGNFQSIPPQQQPNASNNIQPRELFFCQQNPTFALLFITFQPINDHHMIFLARNFYRQVVYLSINPCQDKKYDILRKFASNFESPFLFIFDLIDHQLHHSFLDNDLTKQQFKTLAQKNHLVYFKVKSQEFNLSSFVKQASYYEEKANTLFSQEYNKDSSLSFTQVQKNKIRQSLQEYHQVMLDQECQIFKLPNFKLSNLVKGILKINFERKIPIRLNKQRDLIKFKDFIQAQFLIYQEMQSNKESLKNQHEIRSLGTSSSCLHCQSQGKTNSKTSNKCYACSILQKKTISLCEKCFWPYHVAKGLVSVMFDEKANLNKPIQQGQSANKKIDTEMLLQGKARDVTKKQKKEKKMPKEFIEQKDPELSEQQLKKVQNLQNRASKLIDLMSKLRNPEKFYKAKYPNASSEKQFQCEIKNQNEFMKAIDDTIRKQVEMFQSQVLIKMRSSNSFKNTAKDQKHDTNLNHSDEKEKVQKTEQKMNIELHGSEQHQTKKFPQN